MTDCQHNYSLVLSFTLLIGLVTLGCVHANPAHTADIDSARATSSYWRQFAVKPEDNGDILIAQRVYDRLLITWDLGRVPPQLMVVDSLTGPWAASLTDGTILLSQAALELSLQQSAHNAEDRLAFLLAHELAHQRNQDWWQRRFFSADINGAPAPSLHKDPITQRHPNEDEWQADIEGLVMMTLAGYEPSAVVGDNNFFDTWIESVWGSNCDTSNVKAVQIRACNEAKTRTQHLKTRLRQLADATLLFELGTQAYVMGEFRTALDYFTEFGRLFPSRAVHTNIGLSILGEAQRIQAQLNALNDNKTKPPLLPLVLGAVEISVPNIQHSETEVRSILQDENRRSAEYRRLTRQLEKSTQQAIKAFERALQLAPDHPIGYIHLACAYLINSNTPMAKGLIEGQYQRRFGQDKTSALMLSLISIYENNFVEAHQALSFLVQKDVQGLDTGPLSEQLLLYTATYNLSLLASAEGDQNKSASYWHKLAERSQEDGDTIMFRLSLAHENNLPLNYPATSSSEKINNFRQNFSETRESLRYEQLIQFNNERLIGRHYADGRHIVLDTSARTIAAWVDNTSQPDLSRQIFYKDAQRVLNQFGIPSRTVATERGIYWAYDESGIAFLITDNKVGGWFFYSSKQLPAPPIIISSSNEKG